MMSFKKNAAIALVLLIVAANVNAAGLSGAPGGRIPGGGEAKVDQQAGNGLWNGVCTYKKSITASAFALTGGSAVAYAKFYMFPQASEVVKKAGFQKFLGDQLKLVFSNSSRADKMFGMLVAGALVSGGLLVGAAGCDLAELCRPDENRELLALAADLALEADPDDRRRDTAQGLLAMAREVVDFLVDKHNPATAANPDASPKDRRFYALIVAEVARRRARGGASA